MKLEIEIKNGFIVPQKTTLKDGVYVVEPKNQDLRSTKQNSAFHLYFNMLAVELNDAGYSFKKVMSEPNRYKADIDWNSNLIKEYIWRPIQKVVCNKKSTTQLNKDEVNKIYDLVNRYTSNMGVSVPFPSIEE
jgi:hypothetical protein